MSHTHINPEPNQICYPGKVVVGSCSICGGPVLVHEMWGCAIPDIPTCANCGAYERSQAATEQMNASETPLTDAQIMRHELDAIPAEFDYIDPDFARRLERENARLRELLSACLPHIPAGAYFGDVITKPLDEVCLIYQVRAAIDAARKEAQP